MSASLYVVCRGQRGSPLSRRADDGYGGTFVAQVLVQQLCHQLYPKGGGFVNKGEGFPPVEKIGNTGVGTVFHIVEPGDHAAVNRPAGGLEISGGDPLPAQAVDFRPDFLTHPVRIGRLAGEQENRVARTVEQVGAEGGVDEPRLHQAGVERGGLARQQLAEDRRPRKFGIR